MSRVLLPGRIARMTLVLLVGSSFGGIAVTADGDDEEDEEREEGEDEAGPVQVGRNRNPGHFDVSGTTVNGFYVEFSLDRNTCTVLDFHVRGVAIFSSIDLPSSCNLTSKGGSEGGVDAVEIEGEDRGSKLRFHDNPTALIRFDVQRRETVRFQLAPGVEASPAEDGGSIEIGSGGVFANLFVTDDASLLLNDRSIETSDAKGNFLVHPGGPPQSERPTEAAIGEAITNQHVGGRIDVLVVNGSVVHEALAFDDVLIRAHQPDDLTFRFLVDADLTEGRVFVVNFAPGAFQEGDVGVRFYDLDNASFPVEVPIQKADDIADVLAIERGEGPEFWLIEDENGKQVLVSVPHWSAHVFEVFTASSLAGLPGLAVVPPPPSVVWGLLGGVVFVALASIVMTAGRQKQT